MPPNPAESVHQAPHIPASDTRPADWIDSARVVDIVGHSGLKPGAPVIEDAVYRDLVLNVALLVALSATYSLMGWPRLARQGVRRAALKRLCGLWKKAGFESAPIKAQKTSHAYFICICRKGQKAIVRQPPSQYGSRYESETIGIGSWIPTRSAPILHEARVVALPGGAFGPDGRDTFGCPSVVPKWNWTKPWIGWRSGSSKTAEVLPTPAAPSIRHGPFRRPGKGEAKGASHHAFIS
ncbi:hypothetical protein SAMN02746041_00973 [Desulfacinum hydrothermale DSM 13146]|uniref:Uncharacterized protein n=1 Tax=Desulfacinum hydrothermale DSM 13146 TaxID=1121390 RepID=A0A1W1XAR6_9BACT|nr:hypothetical protein SAMN02746041_00973 [Desulfacinum hydrothermale DSM 13146]